MKFYDYIAQRGGKITLTQINTPPTEWESDLAVFEHGPNPIKIMDLMIS